MQWNCFSFFFCGGFRRVVETRSVVTCGICGVTSVVRSGI